MDSMIGSQLPDFDAWWDYNRPAETAVRFRELLPQAESGADADYTVVACFARAYRLLSQTGWFWGAYPARLARLRQWGQVAGG